MCQLPHFLVGQKMPRENPRPPSASDKAPGTLERDLYGVTRQFRKYNLGGRQPLVQTDILCAMIQISFGAHIGQTIRTTCVLTPQSQLMNHFQPQSPIHFTVLAKVFKVAEHHLRT
uniref:Uncharacterized protein n=1 Tax=Micrurus paraensis TaxID=1970185 RepID=A0A2D4KRJ4_9SAUR